MTLLVVDLSANGHRSRMPRGFLAVERVAIQPPHAAMGRRIRRRQDEARTLERFAGVQPRGSPRRSGLLDFDCI